MLFGSLEWIFYPSNFNDSGYKEFNDNCISHEACVIEQWVNDKVK